MQTETQLNDYQKCKSIIGTLKKDKKVTLLVDNVAVFRKYLSTNAKDSGKTYLTKVTGKATILVIRIT